MGVLSFSTGVAMGVIANVTLAVAFVLPWNLSKSVIIAHAFAFFIEV